MDNRAPLPLARACNACRSKKTRCFTSKTGSGNCERCQRKGIDCVFPRVQPRTCKDRQVQNRVAQLEGEISRIVTTLAEVQHSSLSLEADRPDHSSTQASEAPELASKIADTPAPNSLPDVFSQGLLSMEDAEVLLQRFRRMMRHFPYIVLPEAASVPRLRRDHPLLLLAILVTSSSRDRSLQVPLQREYLKMLSQRWVVEGETSLDMLQGLMVYLGWYHFHLKGAFRLISIAAAIAVDIGLNSRPRESKQEKMAVTFTNANPKGLHAAGPDFWSPEARRTFIGCYVLCSSYSTMLRKLNPLKFTEYVEECAVSLASECEVLSDSLLPYHVRLAHYHEEVSETFCYNECKPQMTEERLQVYMKTHESQLRDWRMSIPLSVADDFNHLYHIAGTHTLEIGLYGAMDATLSIWRTKTLFDCLVRAKNYLDAILALPCQDMQDWCSIEWTRLHYTIILIIKLTLGIDSPSWSIEVARQTITLESYLDMLCLRLRQESSTIHSTVDEGNWCNFLLAQWETARSRYCMGLTRRGIEVTEAYSSLPVVDQAANDWTLNHAQSSYAPLTGFDNVNFMLNDTYWLAPASNAWAGENI